MSFILRTREAQAGLTRIWDFTTVPVSFGRLESTLGPGLTVGAYLPEIGVLLRAIQEGYGGRTALEVLQSRTADRALMGEFERVFSPTREWRFEELSPRGLEAMIPIRSPVRELCLKTADPRLLPGEIPIPLGGHFVFEDSGEVSLLVDSAFHLGSEPLLPLALHGTPHPRYLPPEVARNPDSRSEIWARDLPNTWEQTLDAVSRAAAGSRPVPPSFTLSYSSGGRNWTRLRVEAEKRTVDLSLQTRGPVEVSNLTTRNSFDKPRRTQVGVGFSHLQGRPFSLARWWQAIDVHSPGTNVLSPGLQFYFLPGALLEVKRAIGAIDSYEQGTDLMRVASLFGLVRRHLPKRSNDWPRWEVGRRSRTIDLEWDTMITSVLHQTGLPIAWRVENHETDAHLNVIPVTPETVDEVERYVEGERNYPDPR